MDTTRALVVDIAPDRAAATAERLEQWVGSVTVVPPEDAVDALADRPADVVVVQDRSEAGARAIRDRIRRSRDVPTVVAEEVAETPDAADRLARRVVRALGRPGVEGSTPVLSVDDESRIRRVSDEAAALLDLAPPDALGRPLDDVVPSLAPLHETVAAVAADGDSRSVTVERDDGSHVEAWATAAPDGVHCLLRDVTDRVEREAALRRQRDRLEEFAQTVAHDLCNPLTVAVGRLDLLVETAGVDPDNEHLAALRTALERADELIDDTLQFARESAVDDLETVSVAEVARAAWSTAPTESATLEVRPVGRVLADPEALRRLFENLFRNSVEHGRSDVCVTVGPCERDDGPGGFFVADDGPGIPPEDRDRVFERSYSTTGGGLGLAVVRQVVIAHDWSVRVTEGTDGGARFEVTDVTILDDSAADPDVAERRSAGEEYEGQCADGGTRD
ncbi:MAG: sensor histidine kinase [Haloferacaceae archaeon]